MKKLRKGEIRFIAKKFGNKVFGVYDRANGSWPHKTVELGDVLQDVLTELEAQVEADRLNKKVGISGETVEAPVSKKPRGKKQTITTPPPPIEPKEEWITEDQIADYGEMSEDEKAKYTDGLFEETVY